MTQKTRFKKVIYPVYLLDNLEQGCQTSFRIWATYSPSLSSSGVDE